MAQDATTLYERNGVYVFDAWVKPGPGEKSEMNVAKPRVQGSERSLADSRVRISDTVEEKEIKAEGKGWQTPKRSKTIAKKDQPKFMQSYSRSNGHTGHDESCNCNEDDYSSYCTALDDGYWSDFIRRVPGWP